MSDDPKLAQLKKPLVDPPPEGARVFRLGIVLNGTVSSGAWTAGVLDALMEALDVWQAAKDEGRPVPDHSVRLEVLGGASGGGVCAAILARAATLRFPHAKDNGSDRSNPFWRVWVESLDLAPMLAITDLADPIAPASSLLDGAAIRQAVSGLLAWGVDPDIEVSRLAAARPWLANPFHVGVTLTNLRGVPYVVEFAPDGGEKRQSWFTSHADHALFAFPVGPGAAQARGDERVVPSNLRAPEWKLLGQFAQATAAFPIGLPPVRLKRPTADYEWRAVLLPGGHDGNGPLAPKPTLLTPAWHELPLPQQPGESYMFDAVDGGATNNQPLELVRAGLAGFGNSLIRDPDRATAAIILVDPFLDKPDLSAPASTPLGLLDVADRLFNSFVRNSRFSTADLLLAMDPNVASRFLLTAGRVNTRGEQQWGGAALTTAGAGAFLGFAFRDYRVHDYLLGRRNCREWLRKHFCLPESNPLFGAFPTTDDAHGYRAPDAAGHRRRGGPFPIIPLVDDVATPLDVPDWPVLDADSVDFQGDITDRLKAVIRRTGFLDGLPCDDVTGRAAARLLAGWGAGKANDAIRKAIEEVNARR